MTDNPSRRRMIALTAGAATVALAGCSGGGDESDDENSPSESAENESDPSSEAEMDTNDSEQETVAEEDTGGNESDDDAAAEPEANVVTVGPEENPTMFEPEMLTVESGETVTFEWATDGHNIVVESQPDGGNWNGHESIENTGYTHEHTFEADGEYEYICEPHAPDMRGVVVVGGGATAPENGTDDPTNSTGTSENSSDNTS